MWAFSWAYWPQYLFAGLCVARIGVNVSKHEQSQSVKFDGGKAVWAVGLMCWLLHEGGFW